jgi:hypothetical protein
MGHMQTGVVLNIAACTNANGIHITAYRDQRPYRTILTYADFTNQYSGWVTPNTLTQLRAFAGKATHYQYR